MSKREEGRKKILDFCSEYKVDPAHWTNNRRRMHGLPVLRKSANNKHRFFPPKHELFHIIESVLYEVCAEEIQKQFEELASIGDIELGSCVDERL